MPIAMQLAFVAAVAHIMLIELVHHIFLMTLMASTRTTKMPTAMAAKKVKISQAANVMLVLL